MIPFLPILAVAGTLLLVMGLLGTCWVIIRGSATKEAAESWRDNYDAQKARADDFEQQIAELIGQVQKLTERISVLESEKSRLEKMVTAQAEIQALSAKQDQQHAETMAAILTVSAGFHASGS